MHRLPDEIRMDYAALIEPVAVACHDGRLKAGEDVVVIGGGLLAFWLRWWRAMQAAR